MEPFVIQARDYVAPSGSVVESGDALATQVNVLLQKGFVVRIAFRDMHFVSSSYFNILLRRLLHAGGPDSLSRIDVDFASPLQETLFKRSVVAAVRAFEEDRRKVSLNHQLRP